MTFGEVKTFKVPPVFWGKTGKDLEGLGKSFVDATMTMEEFAKSVANPEFTIKATEPTLLRIICPPPAGMLAQ